MAESKEELKNFLMKVKEESERVGLKFNIQKTKIMASGPIISWQINGEAIESHRLYFGGQMVSAAMKLKDACSLEEGKIYDQPAAAASVVSDSVQPHRWQPTSLPLPWDSPGKNAGVGCHFLLQSKIVKSESEVAQSCPTLRELMDAAYQAPPSMRFSRQENWIGVPLPSPMTNLDSILKSRDITLPTRVCLVKVMVFPVVMYGCELDYKES